MEYMQMIDNAKYMLGRFSFWFSDRYAKRPHLAQVECGRGDDGFGNIVRKDLSGHVATRQFIGD